MSFKGKVAIVTGAAVGIGRAIAIALAEEGADVAGFDVNPFENQEMVRDVQKLGRKGLAIQCDVTDKDEVRRAVDEVVRNFGRIDILVNNAGYFGMSPMVDADYNQTVDSWDSHLGVNARGTFLPTLAAVPTMLKQGSGNILNILTNHLKRDSYAVQTAMHAYDASKWAQLSLTETWSAELKPHGILVNGLCPAATDTPMLRSFLAGVGVTELSAEVMGELVGVASLMNTEDVALAAINILKWGPDGPVGQSPLVVYREDAEKLARS